MSDTLTAPPPEMETRALPVQRRELMIAPGSWNAEARTVEVTWSTGARRLMFDWSRYGFVDEELSLDAGAVRLDRLNNGAPVLDTHDSSELESVIGVVVSGTARIENGAGVATLQLSGHADDARIVQLIAEGIIRNISVGYMVYQYEVTERPGERPLMRAVDWEPAEISFVPVPADAAATVRAEDTAQGGHPCIIRRNGAAAKMETEMADAAPAVAPAPATEETRAAAPAALVATATLAVRAVTTARLLERLNQAGLPEEARAEVIAAHDASPLSERDLNAEIGARFHLRDAAPAQRQQVRIVRDETDTRRAGMEEAILHRMAPRAPLTDLGHSYRGLRLLDLARESLEASGVATRGLMAPELAQRALGMTTSDLPNILANVMNKRLRMAYEENVPTYRTWAKRAPNLPDFKPTAVAQLSGAPDLLPVNEAGEITFGSWSDGRINYSLTTFARRTNISRQTIINDDLRALDRWAVAFAGSAARLENRTVYAQLTGANTLGGAALFATTAGQANRAASNAAIAAASLGIGRAAMRVQRGLAGEELNITPSYLIVPAALEQIAYQFTSNQFVPATAATVNEFRAGGRTALEPIVEPILDATSATRWFLAADSNATDTIEYAYLDGAEGVQLTSRELGGVDGIELMALLDFAAAAIDFRGLFDNLGV